LPSFRVPLQPTRYGVSVQAGGAIVGISFAHSILLAAGVALVFVCFGMLSLPAFRCVLYQRNSVRAASRIVQGVDSALTCEEMERFARASCLPRGR
jgi:hypothetical protein